MAAERMGRWVTKKCDATPCISYQICVCVLYFVYVLTQTATTFFGRNPIEWLDDHDKYHFEGSPARHTKRPKTTRTFENVFNNNLYRSIPFDVFQTINYVRENRPRQRL